MALYLVEQIIGKRERRGMVEYLLKWKNYGDDANSWEPEQNMNCNELIKNYEYSLNRAEVLRTRPLTLNLRNGKRNLVTQPYVKKDKRLKASRPPKPQNIISISPIQTAVVGPSVLDPGTEENDEIVKLQKEIAEMYNFKPTVERPTLAEADSSTESTSTSYQLAHEAGALTEPTNTSYPIIYEAGSSTESTSTSYPLTYEDDSKVSFLNLKYRIRKFGLETDETVIPSFEDIPYRKVLFNLSFNRKMTDEDVYNGVGHYIRSNKIPECIISATDAYSEIMLLLKWKDEEMCELIPSKVANIFCPLLVIQYYEDNLTGLMRNKK